MITIYTHLYIDLDAAASVWFYRRFLAPEAQVDFRPANWDGSDAVSESVILDMDCGLKGEQAVDGKVHACFATLVARHAELEDRQALEQLVYYVDLQDSSGDVVRYLGIENPAVARILNATGLNAITRALHLIHPEQDAMVLEKLSMILDALLEQGRSGIRAEREADAAQWIGQVAISRDAREFATMDVLFARGAQAVVYIDGANLGVVRAQNIEVRMDALPIQVLTSNEAGWFFHPAGFMAARGTRKSPTTTTSAITPEQLAIVVDQLLDTGRMPTTRI